MLARAVDTISEVHRTFVSHGFTSTTQTQKLGTVRYTDGRCSDTNGIFTVCPLEVVRRDSSQQKPWRFCCESQPKFLSCALSLSISCFFSPCPHCRPNKNLLGGRAFCECGQRRCSGGDHIICVESVERGALLAEVARAHGT